MAVRVAVNGFGRIGRNFLRALHAGASDVELVALNDLTSVETNAHLLRYDSTSGRFPGVVETTEKSVTVDGHEIAVFAERNPRDLPWAELGIDVVIESTGRFTKREAAAEHLEAGAKRVIISAPGENADATFVVGVNDDTFDPEKHFIVSNASCTTNCFVPMVKVLDDAFGIDQGLMTTVHAYTNDQELLDLARDNLRRARAAAVNIVPTATGAAKATNLVVAAMSGKLDGVALRVPVQVGSITDFTAIVGAEVDVATVNSAFEKAATSGPLSKVLVYTEDEIVSSDIVGSPASCTYDSDLTRLIPIGGGKTLVKVFGWYDNEWGYSNRLVDLAQIVGAVMDLLVLEDLPPLSGAKVLVRVDFNVPIETGDDGPRVADDFRIRAAIPTLQYLVDQGASVTVITHLGRPGGRPDPRYSVAPVRAVLDSLVPGVELRENLRFDPREEANDKTFAAELSAGFDAYVNDAFGCSHRAHASIVGPPQFLPSVAGRLLESEVRVLSRVLDHPERPFTAVVGGAKVADKLKVLEVLAEKVDQLIIGGGMAFTFLAANGHAVGDSLLDATRIDACRALMAGKAEVLLPVDVVALGPGGEVRHVSADVPDGFKGLDIGDESAKTFANVITHAGTVLWNGPMGMFEDARFADGTKTIAEAVAGSAGFTVVGGGDSVAAVDALGLEHEIDYVSTGGGATLEFIEDGDLPGLKALRDARSRWSTLR